MHWNFPASTWDQGVLQGCSRDQRTNSMNSKTVVTLVGSRALMRSGLAGLLRGFPTIHVFGELDLISAEADSIDWATSDVVLVDLVRTNDAEVWIESHCATIHELPGIVAIVSAADVARMAQLVRAGVAGVVTADCGPEQLLEALETVANGGSWLASDLTAAFIRTSDPVVSNEPHQSLESDDKLASLTPREHEVLIEIASGKTNSEIAQQLNCSEATVKNHVHNSLQKLGLRNRAAAAAYVARRLTRP